MKSKHLIIVLLLGLTFGCKNDTSKPETDSIIKLEGLMLNNNEKWIANEEHILV